MTEDLSVLESSLSYLLKELWHPKSWEAIQRLAKLSIDRPSASLLLLLDSQQDDGCRLHTLALRMGVEAPSITRTVQRLEREGLITRAVDPTDRRATHVLPTRRGLSVIRTLRKAKCEHLRGLLFHLSAEDRSQLTRILQQLRQHVSEQNNKDYEDRGEHHAAKP